MKVVTSSFGIPPPGKNRTRIRGTNGGCLSVEQEAFPSHLITKPWLFRADGPTPGCGIQQAARRFNHLSNPWLIILGLSRFRPMAKPWQAGITTGSSSFGILRPGRTGERCNRENPRFKTWSFLQTERDCTLLLRMASGSGTLPNRVLRGGLSTTLRLGR